MPEGGWTQSQKAAYRVSDELLFEEEAEIEAQSCGGFSPPQLATQDRVAALELVDGGAGDRAHAGGAVDAGLDLAV